METAQHKKTNQTICLFMPSAAKGSCRCHHLLLAPLQNFKFTEQNTINMQQPIVLALAVVVVTILPSITVAFVLPPPSAVAVRLNYYHNGDLGGAGNGYPPESAVAFPPPMLGLEEQQPDDLAMTYDRALDCVNNFGMCEIDELLDLSEELDEYMDSCFVEDGPEACENEIGVSIANGHLSNII